MSNVLKLIKAHVSEDLLMKHTVLRLGVEIVVFPTLFVLAIN